MDNPEHMRIRPNRLCGPAYGPGTRFAKTPREMPLGGKRYHNGTNSPPPIQQQFLNTCSVPDSAGYITALFISRQLNLRRLPFRHVLVLGHVLSFCVAFWNKNNIIIKIIISYILVE